jgi:hypothetical protein
MTPEESELFAVVGRELWRSTLIGDAPPAIKELRERMRDPQPGDLVMEISKWGQFDPDSIGRLVRVDGPDFVLIEPLHRPGEEVSWGNCEFVALPDKRKWLD